jgi:hypothetical protein
MQKLGNPEQFYSLIVYVIPMDNAQNTASW